jgi:hypothetical protein
MGRKKRDQCRLFYEFRLEDRISDNHLLRRMNVFVTVALDDLHKVLERYFSEIGSHRRQGGYSKNHDRSVPAALRPAAARACTYVSCVHHIPSAPASPPSQG